jgi:hypothetical protein
MGAKGPAVKNLVSAFRVAKTELKKRANYEITSEIMFTDRSEHCKVTRTPLSGFWRAV